MKKTEVLINPFVKIAGTQALVFGIIGIMLSTIVGYFTNFHYHGLLHFGPAPNQTWWCFAAERLIVWLVPSLLFYTGGLLLSQSKIRAIDIFGTTAFAQTPLLLMSLFGFFTAYQKLAQIDPNSSIQEIKSLLTDSSLWIGVWLSLVSIAFLVFALYWMYRALQVSCNLKGYKQGIIYCIAVFGGDILCRILIKWLY